MRSSPIIVVLLLCACDAGVDKEAGSPKDRAAPAAASRPPATAPAGSIPAFSSAVTKARDSIDGATELQRLIDTHQKIALDHVVGDSVPASEFVVDVANSPSEYAGEYHFGDSEWESGLTLTVGGNTVTGELGYADWENETWVGKRVRFASGTITGASVSAPDWKAVFVRYRGQPGAVILRAPTDRLGVEFGNKL